MDRVAGKVALISGGARGMGASHARMLVAEGARVVIGDLLDDDGAALAAELGDAVRYVHLDVTKLEDWQKAVAIAVDDFGGLDVLVNNAGIVNFAPIGEYTVDAWNAIIAVNLTGVFLGMTAATSALIASDTGSIINIASTAGIQGYEALPGYTAAKFGVRGLTKAAALDLGKHGVRVNSVHPGVIKTPMTDGLNIDQNHVALGRAGEPEEVSRLIVFLASDDSSFSTGAEFIVDGGETAGMAHFER